MERPQFVMLSGAHELYFTQEPVAIGNTDSDPDLVASDTGFPKQATSIMDSHMQATSTMAPPRQATTHMPSLEAYYSLTIPAIHKQHHIDHHLPCYRSFAHYNHMAEHTYYHDRHEQQYPFSTIGRSHFHLMLWCIYCPFFKFYKK